MNFALKPNFKTAGPVLGGKIKAFGAALAAADAAKLVAELEADGKASLEIDGETTEITKDFVDVRINAKKRALQSLWKQHLHHIGHYPDGRTD